MIEKGMLVDYYGAVYIVNKKDSGTKEVKWDCNRYGEQKSWSVIFERDLISLNPFPHEVEESAFNLLYGQNLFKYAALRNLNIKRRFIYMKRHTLVNKSSEIIDHLAEKYNIDYDSMRKLCYISMPKFRELLEGLGYE
jgi:hypothetical protein